MMNGLEVPYVHTVAEGPVPGSVTAYTGNMNALTAEAASFGRQITLRIRNDSIVELYCPDDRCFDSMEEDETRFDEASNDHVCDRRYP